MDAVAESFRILRVTIEGRLQHPSVIAVSAALGCEGTTYVACGLARAFSETGRRTLLVDANPAASGIADELASGGGKPNLSLVSLPLPEACAGLNVGEIVGAMREEYAVVIVDTPPLTASSIALEFARVADNVLLAVRLGRRIQKADQDLRKQVTELGARVIGIVPTRADRSRRPSNTQDTGRVVASVDRIPHISRFTARDARHARLTEVS